MKKYVLITTVGLFLLAYLLEAVNPPLSNARIGLATPYMFFSPNILGLYPFTTAIIFMWALGVFLIPLLIAFSIEKNYLAKGGAFLVLSALMQLYAVQDIATGAHVIPLEWSIALAGAGALLLLPAVLWVIQGALLGAHHSMVNKVRHNIQSGAQEKSPTWLKSDKTDV